jgi:hypothetical protein
MDPALVAGSGRRRSRGMNPAESDRMTTMAPTVRSAACPRRPRSNRPRGARS